MTAKRALFGIALLILAPAMGSAMVPDADGEMRQYVRARLAVLSEIPDDWAQVALGWLRADTALGPEGLDPGDRHMLHQMIVGAWPLALSPEDDAGRAGFAERLGGWWVKALREAKLRSGWAAPDASYEEKAGRYLQALLVEEAGGSVTDFSGRPYKLDSREVLASNDKIQAELIALFADLFAGRDLAPIPTPQEFAEHRAARAKAQA